MALVGNWNYPTSIRFGAGRIKELPDACKAVGLKRPLLVTDPGQPIKGNSYAIEHPEKSQLPRTLMEAAGRLKASKPARELFGDSFVDHYSATREWEEREFRKAITDWELDRYMEII